MSTQQTQMATIALPVQENASFNINEVIAKYLYHWPLFVLGLILALGGAYYYLQTTPSVYEVRATLLFKDNTKTNETKSLLQELDVASSSKLVESEVEILKSRKLINQVVADLQLWTNYYHNDGLMKEDLYNNSPVRFQLITKSPESLNDQEMDVMIQDNNSFVLQTLDGEQKRYTYGDVIKTTLGTWKLEKTKNLEYYQGATITISLTEPEAAAGFFQGTISVSLENQEAPFVNLSIDDQVPQRGKDILNKLIFLYNREALTDKNRVTQSTLNFINMRLDSLVTELDNAEKAVEDFRSSQGLTDITSEAQVYLQNTQANDARLNEVNVQLKVMEGIKRYINSDQKTANAQATLSIVDEGLNSLVAKLTELQLQREQLLATTPEGNPIFDPLNRQITPTRAEIKEKIKNITSSLLRTRQELQGFNTGFEASIKKIPSLERQYLSIKRQQTIKENLYTYLLQKREEVSMSYASTLADARIVDDAYTGPIKWPNNMTIYAVALLLGIVLPAGLIYSREGLATAITSRKEIEDAVKTPILGELSHNDSPEPIVVGQDRSHFAIGEQFRSLRTNLHYLHGKKDKGRVTLLTSSIGGEGKSFVSSNLGAILAFSGRKTVLLEMDLRKPKVSEAFQLSLRHPGISNFLDEQVTMGEIIQESGIAGLDIIGCGSILPNPSELLEKEKLDELITFLRLIYDDILIDTPPIHLVTDAIIISRATDVSLYMIRQGYTAKMELDFIKEVYKQQKLPKMNIILNDVTEKKFGYSYDNSYYSLESNKSSFLKQIRSFFTRF